MKQPPPAPAAQEITSLLSVSTNLTIFGPWCEQNRIALSLCVWLLSLGTVSPVSVYAAAGARRLCVRGPHETPADVHLSLLARSSKEDLD